MGLSKEDALAYRCIGLIDKISVIGTNKHDRTRLTNLKDTNQETKIRAV